MMTQQDLDRFARSLEGMYAQLCADPTASEAARESALAAARAFREMEPAGELLVEAIRDHAAKVQHFTAKVQAHAVSDPDFRREWRARWFADELAGKHEPYKRLPPISESA